jgi:alkylated DNA nucleotide flippase Atl1
MPAALDSPENRLQEEIAQLTEASKEVSGIAADLLREVARSVELAATKLASLHDEGEEESSIRSLWGKKFLRLGPLGLEQGMTTREVSSASAMNDEPNADKVLAQLAKQGSIELVPNSSPKRWRLTRDQRRNRILRASRLISKGQWTTYGDIAIAVSGNIRVARAVSRVAAKNPAFANPHRVLEKAGTIPSGWKSDDGKGPDECERRLTEEGVRLRDGKAPNEQRINHEELEALLIAREREEGASEGS